MLLSNNSKRLIIFCLIFAAFSVQAKFEQPNLRNYWLQAAPPNAKNMAAYVEIHNNSDEEIALIDAYSPAFKMTMIHKTVVTDGIAKMIHQDKIIIKPHSKLVFKPGGLHIMLMYPQIKFSQGNQIKINLIYLYKNKRFVQETWFPVELR